MVGWLVLFVPIDVEVSSQKDHVMVQHALRQRAIDKRSQLMDLLVASCYVGITIAGLSVCAKEMIDSAVLPNPSVLRTLRRPAVSRPGQPPIADRIYVLCFGQDRPFADDEHAAIVVRGEWRHGIKRRQ